MEQAKGDSPQIICAGMVVVDLLVRGFTAVPEWGTTSFVDSITIAVGGDAINEAVALAKLGNQVGLMGMVGDDVPGQFVRDQCLRSGVAVDGLVVEVGQTTSTGIVMIGTDGEHFFLTGQHRSHADYGPEHIDLSLIKPGLKALSIASLFTSERFDRKAVSSLLRRAKEVGAITFADFVTDQRGYGLDHLSDIWPLLDYVVPSEAEAQVLTGSIEPEAVAADFQRRGVENVILKRGSKGIIAITKDGTFSCPAFKVESVDTTGAGDTFVAGLIHATISGLPMAEALRFGSAAAALSVKAIGAGAGLKSLDQVKGFLEEQHSSDLS